MLRALSFALLLSSSLAAGAETALRLSSPDIAEGKPLAQEQVYAGFGCTGGNRSPALSWEHVPAGTRSFAITAYDPDAPTGSGWWHWVVFDLPATTRQLPAGAGSADSARLPASAVQVRTDFGTPGYGGACPPPGAPAHRYVFTVHALDTERLGVGADATPALVGFMLNQHTIAKASVTALHGR